MKTVSISDLKANLSRYIREVRRGGEVQVLDRGTPIARLVPPAASGDGLRHTLIRTELLRPGKGKAAAILDEAPIQLPASLSDALMEDRTDRL
ncbi:MAG: type II toxin-antitoxin system prevent-host-death family antitoxin [Gammaproteobacteria bacterium]|nr:type II toxin-antitoxin system prevent-host-death family antitoxin [Gammaproteobacteria bacterium]